MKRRKLLIIITFFISLLICVLGGELLARLLSTSVLVNDERNTIFRYDEELGWFPLKNIETDYIGSHKFHVKNNSDGFRDIEHGKKKKKRIAFVGDSYVWGYDVEQNERFTDKLRNMLPSWDIINMGISGYGTDQELLLLEKWYDHYQPDVVFLVFCNNDWKDNITNLRYDGYYKPYFTNSNKKYPPTYGVSS